MIATQMFRSDGECEAFSAGQNIFAAGEEGRVMYVVSEGEVDIVVNGLVVETVGPGGVFGEMALIEHKPRSASAVARTGAKVAQISEKRFAFLVQQTPFFALQLMKVMADRLRRVDARL